MSYKEDQTPEKNRDVQQSKTGEEKIKSSIAGIVEIFDQLNENPPDEISIKTINKITQEIDFCQSIFEKECLCYEIENNLITKLFYSLSFLVDYCENNQMSLSTMEALAMLIATITSDENFKLDFIDDDSIEIIANLVNSNITSNLTLCILCIARNLLDYDPIFNMVKEKLPLNCFVECIQDVASTSISNQDKISNMFAMILAVFARHMPSDAESLVIFQNYLDIFPLLVENTESLKFMFYSWLEIMKLGRFPFESGYEKIINQVIEKYIKTDLIFSKQVQDALVPLISCITFTIQNYSSNLLLDHSSIFQIMNCESQELFYQASCLINVLAYVAQGTEFTQLFDYLLRLYSSTASRKKSISAAISDIVASATPSLASIILREQVYKIISDSLSLLTDSNELEIVADAISNLYQIGKSTNNNSWIEYILDNCYSDLKEFVENSEVEKAAAIVSSVLDLIDHEEQQSSPDSM